MADWLLFVDESGDFKESCEDVLVAGLLLRVGSDWAGTATDPDPIATHLRQAMPYMPWPFHAAHQNLPVTFAIARYEWLCRQGLIHMQLDRVDDSVREAGEYFRNDPECQNNPEIQDLFREAQDAFADGELPRWETLKSLDRRLKSKKHFLHKHLAEVSRVATANILSVTGSFEPSRSGMRSVTDAAVIVAAEASRRTRTDDQSIWRYKTRRWVALLQSVLERAFDILSRIEGNHQVSLRVASLRVYMPEVVPGPHARPLTTEHLNWILNQILPRGCRRWATVQGVVDAEPIHYFNPGTPGALVLADFIANHTCNSLDSRKTLSQFQGVLQNAGRLQVRLIQSGKPPMSHLAALGWPQDAIKAARCGEKDPERPQEELARWATEQAEVWVHVLRGHQ